MSSVNHAPAENARRRLIFVVNNVAFFVSHRLPIAERALQEGYKVELITGGAGSPTLEKEAVQRLRETGVPHYRVAFQSGGTNPVLELWGFLQLVWRLRRQAPSIVHCVSPKGLLYGGLAARLAGIPCLVLAVSGMGYAFTGNDGSRLRLLLRMVYSRLVRFAYGHRNKRVIVQNRDDEGSLLKSGVASAAETVLIPGSGVVLDRYVGAPIEAKENLVVLPARMLIDKGIAEFAAAAGQLHAENPSWQFVLAGTADYENPSAVTAEQLRQWQQERKLTWVGHVEDMAPLLARASIVCLPSYREGMPKALLEAAAAGCAVVTTDVVGCREAIVDGQTGDLVPVRDAAALTDCLRRLMRDHDRRRQYGEAGRQLAISRYSIEAVLDRTLKIYGELIANGKEQH